MEIYIGFGSSPRTPTRPQKGCSFLGFVNEYVVVDIETTGLDPSYDDIIEVAAVHFREDKEVARFSTLVQPEEAVSSFITNLTGITNDMLANAPALGDILAEFLAFLGSRVIVGHNVNFDINFLYDASERLGLGPLTNDFVDTMRISRKLSQDLPNHKLQTVVRAWNVGETIEHRALADVLQTAQCYMLMGIYAKEHDIDIERYGTAKRSAAWVRAKDIHADATAFDPEHPLFEKTCVFTGALQNMTRSQAMQAVVDLGGHCADSVSKKVNFLILGNNDYCATIRDGKSSKQKKAEELLLKGHDIQILSESVFYDMLQDNINSEVCSHV